MAKMARRKNSVYPSINTMVPPTHMKEAGYGAVL